MSDAEMSELNTATQSH